MTSNKDENCDCSLTIKWLPWKCDIFSSKTDDVENYSLEETLLSWSLGLAVLTISTFYTIYFVIYKSHTNLIYTKGVNYDGLTNFCNKDITLSGCRCLHNSSTVFDCDLIPNIPVCSEYICHGWIDMDFYHIMFSYFSGMGGILGFVTSLHMGIFLFFKNKYIKKMTDIVDKVEEIYENNVYKVDEVIPMDNNFMKDHPFSIETTDNKSKH